MEGAPFEDQRCARLGDEGVAKFSASCLPSNIAALKAIPSLTKPSTGKAGIQSVGGPPLGI